MDNHSNTLDRVADELRQLDRSLRRLNETNSRVRHYDQQRQSIETIRKLVRYSENFFQLDEQNVVKKLDMIDGDDYDEAVILDLLDNILVVLSEKMKKVDDTDSKVEGYIEQQKALHEMKKVLHKIGKYQEYDPHELDNIESLIYELND